MSKIDEGGPAFPGGQFEPQHGGSNDREPWNAGMTLRQYYAGQIMAGFAANPNIIWTASDVISDTVRVSLSAADALIAALKGGEA